MDVKSIQCKSCAAPLKLYGGGHRIRSLSCEYCGAVMDARDDYALLDKFSNQDKPTCPLDIGMQGKVKDITFIIIGMIGYRSHFGDRWVDLSIFSETHGYAWLSYHLGHFTFSRRVRDLPNKDMRHLGIGSQFKAKGLSYQFFEAYQAEITYVAGELTWVAKLDDKSILRDAISPPFMFSLEETENEQEYYLTEYIEPDEIKAGFGLNFDNHRSSIHPAQSFKAPIREALSKVSRVPLILSLLVIFAFSIVAGGKTIFSEKISSFPDGRTIVRDFTIDSSKHLVEIKFDNPYANRWQIKDITLFDEQNEVFSFAKRLASNTSSLLSEQTGKARFFIKKPGNYSLRMTVSKGKDYNNPVHRQAIHLSVKQGVMGNKYFKYLLYVSVISFLIFYISRYFFEKKRWALSH
jgi:hypothetical protein